jgi:hypothetical protein
MTEKFQKPFIPRPSILNEKPGDPEGYVTKDGMWAAVPFGKKFVILHNGQQVHIANNYASAKLHIHKQIKILKKASSSLEQFLTD